MIKKLNFWILLFCASPALAHPPGMITFDECALNATPPVTRVCLVFIEKGHSSTEHDPGMPAVYISKSDATFEVMPILSSHYALLHAVKVENQPESKGGMKFAKLQVMNVQRQGDPASGPIVSMNGKASDNSPFNVTFTGDDSVNP